MARRARILFALVGLAVAALPSGAGAAPVVEFLYADAGEAGASGGHVALRVDDAVYHYQRDGVGVLVIRRDAWRTFAFQYRIVENRNLSASRIDVGHAAAERLRRHFDARVVSEWAEREHLEALRDDVALLEALASDRRDAAVAVPGAGFFAEARADGAGAGALAAIRARIARERGPEFLAAKRRAAEAALRAVLAAGAAREASDTPWSRRHADAVAAVLALDVLEASPPLRDGAWRALPGALGRLTERDLPALRARRDALEASLAEGIDSNRPDWGFSFLLGAARLAAVDASFEGGRLAVLALLSQPAPRVPVAGAEDAGAAHLAWRRTRVASARVATLARPTDESALARLEREAALHGELVAALREKAVSVLWDVPAAPRGRGTVNVSGDAGDSTGDVALAAARLAEAERARAERAGYDLLTRNCVTELFGEVEIALAGSEDALPRPPEPLAFVPFLAERAVAEHWPATPPRALPSGRRDAAAAAPGWLARLRESNTLTSTRYTPHAGDSIFLFFTDDAVAVRPILGAANLAAGAIASGVGVLALPFDRGTTLDRGVRGIAASVPELFFFNVRKGTFPWALPPVAARLEGETR